MSKDTLGEVYGVTVQKGGVGKSTFSQALAYSFANQGFKTVLVDLGPQCNLSRLALWEDFDNNLLSSNDNNIYWVLKWIFKWGADINLNIKFQEIRENLSILPWNLKLSEYQNLWQFYFPYL